MRHLFVCTNTIPGGKPSCGRRGGLDVIAAVQKELVTRGVAAWVTPCGCLGPCFDGPNAVVYPEGVWYGALTAEDSLGLADHLCTGTVYKAKRIVPPGDTESSSD